MGELKDSLRSGDTHSVSIASFTCLSRTCIPLICDDVSTFP